MGDNTNRACVRGSWEQSGSMWVRDFSCLFVSQLGAANNSRPSKVRCRSQHLPKRLSIKMGAADVKFSSVNVAVSAYCLRVLR